jgi:hypothetical protein
MFRELNLEKRLRKNILNCNMWMRIGEEETKQRIGRKR